jgi:hypothetical protein
VPNLANESSASTRKHTRNHGLSRSIDNRGAGSDAECPLLGVPQTTRQNGKTYFYSKETILGNVLQTCVRSSQPFCIPYASKLYYRTHRKEGVDGDVLPCGVTSQSKLRLFSWLVKERSRNGMMCSNTSAQPKFSAWLVHRSVTSHNNVAAAD